ncbi:hypothetical protein GCM10017771_68220 [Streptomyces capitiformicae]|uniref:Uncharacterized protein n=1 Tax=Streptomyces capitiformicae TaxID=2014920 RepID=A0A918ZDS3_9ACTN|nr:hypothetical protein GCM10017771_68220 [Streptomyces capitiformicae]
MAITDRPPSAYRTVSTPPPLDTEAQDAKAGEESKELVAATVRPGPTLHVYRTSAWLRVGRGRRVSGGSYRLLELPVQVTAPSPPAQA